MNIKKIVAVFIVFILFITNFYVRQSLAVGDISFKKGTYKLDETETYILNIPNYTTVHEFKKNITQSAKVVGVNSKDEKKEYIKTGDVVNVGTKAYMAVVLGDIDGDGKCTYKDILMEQWLYDNPDSDLTEYQKMKLSRRKSRGGLGGASAEEVLQTCPEVLQWMIDTDNKYSLGAGLHWGDIAKSAESNYYCCATFVSVVLYKSGALTEDQINSFNYNYTGAGGIPDMLEAAGWYQVPVSEAKPGDIINNYGIHVMIYAGNGSLYDEDCAQGMKTTSPRSDTWPYYESSPLTQIWRAPAVVNKTTSDKLQGVIDNDAKSASSSAGGNWSIYATSIKTGEQAVYNNAKMQSASLIKLYIMGTVYDDYDNLKSKYSSLDNDLYNMITISDNNASNRLINLLGNNNSAYGRDKINAFCQSHGYSQTSIGRNLLESNAYGDNYTSVSDCGKFLEEVYNKKLKHSDQMLNLLKQQKVTTKIPAGLPGGVQFASKTGELSDVENDAAIILTDSPYILVVMSENLSNTSSARSQIQAISRDMYNYFK